MVEIELDGRKVEIAEGSMVMHAAEKAGTYIPHFCYHKKLSIAANCRMCLVDVEKAPKPMPACATPVTQGMIVRTKSEKAIKAQQSVMEFLLINHPLDCPICDQGGECQLQDIAVGYGGSSSRYAEEKRVVATKDIGPLISMQEMSRCIHCTRCVRFGQEVAGIMELGMVNRGEHAEITTVLNDTVDSELSGNMIDICPVGALTSKPFRYSARTWELGRRKSISPHDSTGSNVVVQVKNNRVMRVVPLENESVNECWIADRDRFSYEALNGADRLTNPMIKQGGEWRDVDWQTALEYVANGLRQVRNDHGGGSIGLLASPHSTLEELSLSSKLIRALGSDSIDYRLRSAEFSAPSGVRWLGMPIAALSSLDRAFVVGSDLRKDHPLFAQRLRQAVRRGAQVHALKSGPAQWAMPMASCISASAQQWLLELASLAAAVAQETKTLAPVPAEVTAAALVIAKSLLSGSRKAVLLGNGAAHHSDAGQILALSQWIAQACGATVGYLCEAANTVGAQFADARPQRDGANAAAMLRGDCKAILLLGCEPEFDSAAGLSAVAGLNRSQMVVTLNAFKTNLAFSDVLLPIAPFTETSGTFVNAEGTPQSFHAVVKPLGETRPGWKVLRVIANMLELPGFEFESSQAALAAVDLAATKLSNETTLQILPPTNQGVTCSAPIYQLDGLVRRSVALQHTADGRAGNPTVAQPAAQEVLA